MLLLVMLAVVVAEVAMCVSEREVVLKSMTVQRRSTFRAELATSFTDHHFHSEERPINYGHS